MTRFGGSVTLEGGMKVRGDSGDLYTITVNSSGNLVATPD